MSSVYVWFVVFSLIYIWYVLLTSNLYQNLSCSAGFTFNVTILCLTCRILLGLCGLYMTCLCLSCFDFDLLCTPEFIYDVICLSLICHLPLGYIWCGLYILTCLVALGLYLTWFVCFTFMFTWIHIWYGQFIFNLGFFGSIFVMSRLCLTCHVVVNSYLIRLICLAYHVLYGLWCVIWFYLMRPAYASVVFSWIHVWYDLFTSTLLYLLGFIPDVFCFYVTCHILLKLCLLSPVCA